MQLEVVAFLVCVALVFDFINGFHDAANSIATVVSTRVLSPGKAVIWAAVFNFIAAFGFGTAVAKTIGSGMIDVHYVTFLVIFCALFGAIVWDLITWYYGLPTSSSHALIGGYAGGAIAHAGMKTIIVSGWTKTLIFIVLAPAIGLVLGYTFMVAIYWIFRWAPPSRVDKLFRRLQLVSAAALQPRARRQRRAKDDGHHRRGALRRRVHPDVPHPVLGHPGRACVDWPRDALRRVAHHPHDGIEDHAPAAGRRLRGRDRRRRLALRRHGARRARQHDAHDTGAIVGVGATRRLSAVRWGVAGQIVWAWVLTIPAAAAISSVSYWLLSRLLGTV